MRTRVSVGVGFGLAYIGTWFRPVHVGGGLLGALIGLTIWSFKAGVGVVMLTAYGLYWAIYGICWVCRDIADMLEARRR